MNELKVVEVIEKMADFMKHTNEMLDRLNTRMDNIEVDIQKLRKKNRIFIPEVSGGNGSNRLGQG